MLSQGPEAELLQSFCYIMNGQSLNAKGDRRGMESLHRWTAVLTNPGAILPSAFLIIPCFVQPFSVSGVGILCYWEHKHPKQQIHCFNKLLQIAKHHTVLIFLFVLPLKLLAFVFFSLNAKLSSFLLKPLTSELLLHSTLATVTSLILCSLVFIYDLLVTNQLISEPQLHNL